MSTCREVHFGPVRPLPVAWWCRRHAPGPKGSAPWVCHGPVSVLKPPLGKSPCLWRSEGEVIRTMPGPRFRLAVWFVPQGAMLKRRCVQEPNRVLSGISITYRIWCLKASSPSLILLRKPWFGAQEMPGRLMKRARECRGSFCSRSRCRAASRSALFARRGEGRCARRLAAP